ncbi:hypothetical protein HPB51_019453 [Rhipicephalus microplus]|uniref:Uncharacterized protein n=1 Tax=Rhipicephalus microplus TaxID=6941 RepID=A0A9J6DPY5_RHIMP|nr:hypothetical protein HPB51_019453 [Rhipicephalus microplus]
MSEKPQRRYRQYLKHGSSVQVPRQTLANAAKKAKRSSTAQISSHLQNDTCQNSASSSRNQSGRNASSECGHSVDAALFQCAAQECAQSSTSSLDGVSVSCDLEVTDHSSASAASLGENTSDSETIDPEDIDDNCANDDANGSESDKQGAPNDFIKLSEETLSLQKTTKAQALLVVIAYIVTAGLTWAKVRGLLILLNTLFGGAVVPSTTYLLRKLWKDKKDALRIHLYCRHCHDYLGISQEMPARSQVTCGGCNVQRPTKELIAAGSFCHV